MIQLINSRRMKWSENVAHKGDRSGTCRVLMWGPDGKTRRRREDCIGMDLQEVGLGGMDCIGLAQDSAGDGLLCM